MNADKDSAPLNIDRRSWQLAAKVMTIPVPAEVSSAPILFQLANPNLLGFRLVPGQLCDRPSLIFQRNPLIHKQLYPLAAYTMLLLNLILANTFRIMSEEHFKEQQVVQSFQSPNYK